MDKNKGYIQVYTGNGKGKTTAAMGLALRAAGAKKKILIAQFVKGMKYSELISLKILKEYITVKQFGLKCFIKKNPSKEDIEIAQKGLASVKRAIQSKKYDIIILDEANIAVFYSLFSAQELIDVINLKPDAMEIIITGRYADKTIIKRADLVTEMKEVKHYYSSGVQARVGIEK